MKKRIFFICFIIMSNFGSAQDILESNDYVNINIDFVHEVNTNGLYFIIYYNHPVIRLIPLTVEQIKNGVYDYKIVVTPSTIKKYIQYFSRLNYTEFIINNKENALSWAFYTTEILCEFANNKNEVLLSYTIGGVDYNFLNDQVVERNEVLYDLVKLFIPKCENWP
ncbi:MAG: hypothetical protein Ta2B_10000 [Termitinemataceae bacterium]|nr:MAG: hypothetical protein Ta2B_10000 [Termitinemataceae bacterium]